MTNATIELYEALIAAGVEESRARAAASSVMSSEQAKETFATKADLEAMFRKQNMWIAGLFIGQVIVFTTLNGVLFGA